MVIKKVLVVNLVLSLGPCNILWAIGGAPPIQTSVNGAGSGTALGTSFLNPTTANNIIYVVAGQASATWTSTDAGNVPNDSCGDTFVEAPNSPVTGTGMRLRIYTTKTSGGCISILLNSSVDAAYNVFIAEYTNMALTSVVDCTASGSGNSTSLLTGTCTTAYPNETLVVTGMQTVSGAIYTVGSSYMIEAQAGGTGHSSASEDANVRIMGNYTGSMTSNTTGNWIIHILGLRNLNQRTGTLTIQ